MKYITTDKNPILKEGLIINGTLINSEKGCMKTTEEDIMFQLGEGYIKELQEPEFTKSDMIEFRCFTPDSMFDIETSNIDYTFNEWLKQRNK